MKSLKILAIALLSVFCLSTFSVDAQNEVRKEKKTRISTKKDVKPLKQYSKKGMKTDQKLEKGQPLNKRVDGKVNGKTRRPVSGEIKEGTGFKKGTRKRNNSSNVNNKTNGKVVSANKTITSGKIKSMEMRKKIGKAKQKLEEAKKSGKYSKAEIVEKEAKLKAAEQKVKELEQTLKEESNTISKAARGLK